MGRKKKYLTEEERLAARRESQRKYAENNPDKVKESNRKYYQENSDKVKERNRKSARKWREENPEKEKERQRKYQSTPIGRANILASAYRQSDKKQKRGEYTITGEWIVDNIFTSKCIYCDESDWHKLGCDRIYNSLTHTPENVVPCCEECNKKRGTKDFVDFLKEIGRLDKLKELKDKVIITDNVFAD